MEPVSLSPSQCEHKGFLQFIMKRNGPSGAPAAPGAFPGALPGAARVRGDPPVLLGVRGCCPPATGCPEPRRGARRVRSHPHPPLLIQPALGAVLPAEQLGGAEPERDLAAGTLHGVAAVDHIPARGRRPECGQGPHEALPGGREGAVSRGQGRPYLPTSMQKSPRTVPGGASAGSVAPMSARETRTTSRPCHTWDGDGDGVGVGTGQGAARRGVSRLRPARHSPWPPRAPSPCT